MRIAINVKPTVVFRADASLRMGTGHVMRCLTLAEALQARRMRASFICRAHPGSLIAALRQRSLEVAALPAPATPASSGHEDYAEWLGVPAREDADQTIQALRGAAPDWLVVDHYGLDAEWERQLRPHVGRLLVIEDLANRPHECDALLDQNYAVDGGDRHRGVVPERCERLLGPRYALLAPEYARYRRAQPARDAAVRRVLVYFGGADPADMTGQALAALSAPAFSHLTVDLVIGTNHPRRDALETQAAARPGTHVYGTRPHLADLMAGADLAIGGGGGTTWERMCLGLPALVVSIAENQRPTCEALGAAGLIAYLGDARTVTAATIREALASLLADPERLAQLSSRGRVLVDGAGASRVVDVLLGGAGGDPIVARNTLHDADACPAGFETFTFAWIDRCRADEVLALRNMPHVTAQMRSRGAVAATDHRRFLDQYDRLDRYDFVLIDTSRDRYVGAFYVTHVGATPEIGKYIGDVTYLGKGIAHQATERLVEFCRTRAGLRRLTSMTRRDNLRNVALNARLGFIETGTEGEYLVMTLDL